MFGIEKTEIPLKNIFSLFKSQSASFIVIVLIQIKTILYRKRALNDFQQKLQFYHKLQNTFLQNSKTNL